MKKIVILFFALGLLAGNYSCQDYFLQKPDTSGTVDLKKVFSNTKDAEGLLFACYRNSLNHGWPSGWGIGNGMMGTLSGEISKGYNWHGVWAICDGGLSVTGTDGSDAGTDHFGRNWEVIRACFTIIENIDKVPDMDDARKKYVKGEAIGLIAYRYMGMFYRYGGVPIVRNSFTVNDDMAFTRATLQEMLDYTIELIDEAYQLLPDSWANIGGAGIYVGRLTKGAVLAMKARLRTFAARPLFNSASPVIDFPDKANNNLICFGNVDVERWKAAIDANEAVLAWAKPNGYELYYTAGPGKVNTFDDAAKDYGRATSALNSKEVILAYKVDDFNRMSYWHNQSAYHPSTRYDTDCSGMVTNFLEYYYAIDGKDIDWPKIGEPMPRPVSNFVDNINKIEARFRVDVCVPGLGTLSNPNDSRWQPDGWGRSLSNYENRAASPSALFPNGRQGGGCGFSCKYYYEAGSRTWMEPPLFRMAEIYLHLAEAYNEYGNPTKALENLNMVHNRAGLPSITETNKELLRSIIWREKAIEYFNECQRYYDVKHWKHPDRANIHGGIKRELVFRRAVNTNLLQDLVEYWDAVAFSVYWHDKQLLEPFPQNEVNKGHIVQNPGY